MFRENLNTESNLSKAATSFLHPYAKLKKFVFIVIKINIEKIQCLDCFAGGI